MIFGFNTDVLHEGVVYHVQSEVRGRRDGPRVLQTQVFVAGRCSGKREVHAPECADEELHQMLKAQHRGAVESIRAGRVQEIAGSTEEAALQIECTNAGSIYSAGSVQLQVRVSDGGQPVRGARITARLQLHACEAVYAYGLSDVAGYAALDINIEESALTESALLVRAAVGEKSTTRKFRLRQQ